MDIKLNKPLTEHVFKVGDIFKDGGCIRLIASENYDMFHAVSLDGNIGYHSTDLDGLLDKYGNPEFVGRLEIEP